MDLRNSATEKKAEVVGDCRKVIGGTDPTWLASVAANAKRKGAILLARDTTRFIPHPYFHLVANRDVLPRKSDFEYLEQCVDGVPLMTLWPVDATPNELTELRTAGKSGRKRKRKYQRIRRQAYAIDKLIVAGRLGIF